MSAHGEKTATAAGCGKPWYERLALQLIGINEFVLLTEAPAGSATSAMAS